MKSFIKSKSILFLICLTLTACSSIKNLNKSDAQNGSKILSNEMTDKKKKSRQFSRSLFVVKDIKAGEVITKENVRSIRPGYGLHPKYLKKIIGKKINKYVDRGTAFSIDMISEL